MVTFFQYIKQHRRVNNLDLLLPILMVVFSLWYMCTCGVVKPKKPNSAQRKILKFVLLTGGI